MKGLRILLTLSPNLLRLIDQVKPPGQSRAEWIREAIRQRVEQQTTGKETP